MTQAIAPWIDVLLTVLVLVGATFALIGSFALVRLSRFLLRLHGPTKATTLGVGCILASSALFFSVTGTGISMREILIAAFLFLTAPLSAMMLARAAASLDDGDKPPPQPED